MPNKIDSLLDIGCGSGVFAKAIKDQYGCEVWGIEPVSSAAKIAIAQ